MKNERARTVDRANAYEVRFWRGEAWYALKYYQADNRRPAARVRVSHGEDVIGHDMYVRDFEQYYLIDNPLVPMPEPSNVPVQLVFTDCIDVATGKPERCGTAEIIDTRSEAPLCEMCDTWVATQFVNSYAVCDKPRCQDQAAVLPNLGQPRTA